MASIVRPSGFERRELPVPEAYVEQPARKIRLQDDMLMWVGEREARIVGQLNEPAISILLSASDLAADQIPMVRGDAVVVAAGGVTRGHLERLLALALMDDETTARRDEKIQRMT